MWRVCLFMGVAVCWAFSCVNANGQSCRYYTQQTESCFDFPQDTDCELSCVEQPVGSGMWFCQTGHDADLEDYYGGRTWDGTAVGGSGDYEVEYTDSFDCYSHADCECKTVNNVKECVTKLSTYYSDFREEYYLNINLQCP